MIGRDARPGVEEGQAVEVALAVEALDGNAFRRLPESPPALARRGAARSCPGDRREIGDHAAPPIVSSMRTAAGARRTPRLRSAIGRCSARQASSTGRSLFSRIERRADDRRACRRDIARRALVARRGDARLDVPAGEALQDAAFRFDRLELRPGRLAQRVGQRLDAAGAGGRIGDEVELAFAGHDELRVAGDAAGERVRQAMRDRVRQDRDRIGAAGGGREAGDRGAQDVGLGILRRHHAVGRFGMDCRRRGRDRARLLHPRPELAQRPDLGHRQELVLIDAERKADMRRGVDQRLARLLEHPQMRDRARRASMPSSCASVAPALWKTRPSASSSTPGTPSAKKCASDCGIDACSASIDMRSRPVPAKIAAGSMPKDRLSLRGVGAPPGQTARPASRPCRGSPDERRCADGCWLSGMPSSTVASASGVLGRP